MKNELNYIDAYQKLEELLEQLEDGTIPLDELTATVKQANELIAICEKKLRCIESEVDEAAKAVAIR